MDQNLIDKISKGDPEKMAAIEKVIKDYMAAAAAGKPEAAQLSPDAQNALKAVARLLMPFKEELPPELMQQVMAASGMSAPAPAPAPAAKDAAPGGAEMDPMADVKDEHKMAAHKVASEAYKGAYKQEIGKLGYQKYAQAPVNEGGATAGNKQGDEQTMSQPVTKADGSLDLSAVPEAVRPAVELIYKAQQEAVAKAATLEKELKHEREQRVLKEFKEKAAQFKNLGNGEELATVLKSLTESAPEAAAKMEAILKAADERIEKSKLFEELGSSLPAKGGSIWEQIEKSAEAAVAKSGEKVSKAEAVETFLKTSEGQKMYAEYKNQRGGV